MKKIPLREDPYNASTRFKRVHRFDRSGMWPIKL